MLADRALHIATSRTRSNMATEYVQTHKLAGTIEKALTEALASQPENQYEALAAWFAAKASAPAPAPAKAAAPKAAAKAQDDFGTGEKEAGEANGYGTVAVDLAVRAPRPPPLPPAARFAV